MEALSNAENPITADDINMEGMEDIDVEDLLNTSAQSRDIYKVQPKRNRTLKIFALHILKYLPEDILREEPDFSSIKSNNTIQDYGPCGDCDVSIFSENPPRSLVLNVCGDVIHRTCASKPDKRGALYCSCGVGDDRDPLLPPQYREKSSIPESDRPSLVNLRNLGYNILKSLDDKTVRDIDFPELGPCSECGNDILMSPLKAFTYLKCGHFFHRLCIEKKLFLGTPSACPYPECGKNVDILEQTDIVSNMQIFPLTDPRRSSGISPLMGETFVLSSPPIRMEGIENTATQQAGSNLRCAKCSEDLSSCLPSLGSLQSSPKAPSKPLVYLTCKHIVHYNCIDNPRKLCPICPSTNDMETDDMETDDDDMVTNNSETQGSSTTQNKRTMNPASTEKSSSKRRKTSNKDDISPFLKKLIKELSTSSSESSTTDTQPAIADPGNLTDLYNAIITAEKENSGTNQEVIKGYYLFGEQIENMFDNLKSTYRERKAQRELVAEVTKQLPSDLSKNSIEKRIERARKIYDLFSNIGYDKIMRIKTFFASQIYKLSWEDIDIIEKKVKLV
jgi:flagellar hook-basal body complex protein FliE